MEKLSSAVLESFGIHTRRIRKVKGRYLCDTPKGLMCIHIAYEPTEAICLQHSIKEYLAENGFPWTDRYQPANTGRPYMQFGREAYVMTMYPHEYREIDFENDTEVLQAFNNLARFHIAARDMPQDILPIPYSPPMQEIFKRHINELAQAGKQARRGPRMSDFDVFFIKHAHRYKEVINESIYRLAGTGYAKLYEEAARRGHLCHNSLKEENILPAYGSTYFINFAEAVIDLHLADLAALIRRYAQRSSKSIPAGRLLEAYDAANPLPGGAHDILYALLIFPWAFVKIVAQYYSKRRNWTPNGLLNRMDSILAERESYEAYVNEL